MEISELTLKIILLLIPGAISALIVEQLTIHKQWSSFRFVMSSIVLGCISYLVLQFVYWIPCITIENRNLNFWHTLTDTITIPYTEIFFASLCAIFIGFVISKGIQHKWLFKLSKKFKVSTKFGDESLYYYFLCSDDLTDVYVRDFDNNLTYHGVIDSFSESEIDRELVLINVDVYDLLESKLLYSTPAIFLSKPKNCHWQIEKPNTASNEERG